MKTDLQLSHLVVVPGEQGRVLIEVTNNADVIDGVTAIVDGINQDWIRLDRPLISLFPDASDQLELVLDIPPDCPAGDYMVIVRIVSTIDADRQTVHDFWLTVTSVPALDITLTPSIVSGGSQALVEATITNTGNAIAEVSIDALEPNREIDCIPEPRNFSIPQGANALVEIGLRGKRPWFGDPVPRQIVVTARVDDVVVEKIATFRQRPKVPRGLLTALILACIVILWALIFWFAISRLTRTEDAPKVMGSGFVDGSTNIPLASIAATLEGTVTATTTGAGVPRITVEAQRVTSDGTLESVGSVATDDEGAYSLKSLIPGTYKVRFSADGYQTVWFDGAGDASTAAEVRLDPLQVVDDLDVEMTGNLGTLVGKIDVPEDSLGDPLTVTVTQVPERDDAEASDTPVIPPIVTTNGEIVLEGLPTPATYRITVTGDGFTTQQFDQTVSGGEVSVINTVQLTADAGTIQGVVVDGNDQPLGGVAITARSGDFVVRSVTPTSGNTGQFQIVGLQTPGTYSLTFELPNYTSSTVALSLGPGQSSPPLNVKLFGGSGTVTGVAVSADGTAVGGATVTVLGGDVEATTTTLTTGEPGLFAVTGLPVPGDYTISITGEGFQTETLGALFFGGGTRDLGTVTVLPVNSQVSGTVSTGGAGLGEVTVTLTNGIRPRVTTSATNPAGSFAFAGVPAGSYTLTFERFGYQTKVVLITVVAGVNLTQNTSIVPAAP